MESYLQGQDLWEVVAGTETTPPDNADALRKWRIKAGKALFVLKTTIEEDLLEHICNILKFQSWKIFVFIKEELQYIIYLRELILLDPIPCRKSNRCTFEV